MSRRKGALTALVHLSRRDQRIVAHAALLLCSATVIRRLAPPHLLYRVMSTKPKARRQRDGASAERMMTLVDATARRLPFSTSCLDRAMAARWMLRNAGVPAALVLGTAVAPPFAPHAWVDVTGTGRDTAAHRVLWYSR